MPHIVEDRVLESTTSTGTGTIALAAAITGFRRFSAVCAVADTVPYLIEAIDATGQPTGDYEYGIGTYSSANTLTRTTVLGSSNAGAAVNFAAGTKNVALSLLSSGFQYGSNANGRWLKHPSGAIEQFGAATSSAGGAQAVTLPIPFPTAIRSLVITPAIAGQAVLATTESQSASGFTFSIWTLAGVRAVAAGFWVAKGD